MIHQKRLNKENHIRSATLLIDEGFAPQMRSNAIDTVYIHDLQQIDVD
jgi:hypothetical protein